MCYTLMGNPWRNIVYEMIGKPYSYWNVLAIIESFKGHYSNDFNSSNNELENRFNGCRTYAEFR